MSTRLPEQGAFVYQPPSETGIGTVTIDLPTALENARTFVRERAVRHAITLNLLVDERLGDFVGDERKIKQILLNLLSNAVKLTPGGGRIGIKASQADGLVEISVSNTGIGIAPVG